jgi:hypothetical protein
MQYQAALKWALRTSYVYTTIPGITNFQKLEENLTGSPLSCNIRHPFKGHTVASNSWITRGS